MNAIRYPIKLTEDDNGSLLVSFPDFEEAHTFGEDHEEALFHATDLLEAVIHHRINDRETIPKPSRVRKGQLSVTLPSLPSAKLLLYWEMQENHLRKSGLARKLSWHGPQVDRLLDVFHESKISQLDTAFAALGKRMVIGLENINQA